VLRNLPRKLAARCVVIGAGRAWPAMAAALDTAWLHVDVSGMEVTRHGHAVPDLKRLRRRAERIGTRHDIRLASSP
jgi:glycerate-2-kinase